MTSYKVGQTYHELKRRHKKKSCKNKSCHRHAFNIKTKCCRSKCEKALKKKLRTYKIHPNGVEDIEVLNVSHIFLSTLKIRSPVKQSQSPQSISEFSFSPPKNYLFKMARRKLKVKSNSPEAAADKNKIPFMFLKAKDSNSHQLNEKSPIKNGELSDKQQISPNTESQERKQTNAFKLLMDSRNKSIGGNSPGKEKQIDPCEMEKIIEKKTIKAKRNLALKKFAEAKGATKNKEIEEIQEKCIKDKMEKRAERLKKLLSNAKNKTKPKKRIHIDKNPQCVKKKLTEENEEVIELDEVLCSRQEKQKDKDPTKNKAKTLHLVDMFEDVNPKKNPDKKLIPKEDEAFIKKLSPSIKKKENMLCYFQKVEKKIDSTLEAEDSREQSPIIKVKVRGKKQIKRRKLSLNKDANSDVLKDHNENNSCSNNTELKNCNESVKDAQDEENITKERKKRKPKENSNIQQEAVNSIDSTDFKDSRPKRNVKRPIKYVDDVQLSSSDDELCIFTPRKKRHVENKNEPEVPADIDEIVVSDEESSKKATKLKKKSLKEHKLDIKPTKLAPIFVPKPLLNQEQLEARQKFLYSGVPDKIKKIQTQQKNLCSEFRNEFPTVVHVQQINTNITKIPELLLLPYDSDEDEYIQTDNGSIYKEIIKSAETKRASNFVHRKHSSAAILHNIKEMYPKFPVYRTFRLLKSKSKEELKELNTTELDNSSELQNSIVDTCNENPEFSNWTDKYKANSTKHMIGNFEAVKEMRKWLTTWTETEFRSKNTPTQDSDSSDFCYDSDSNSRDCMKSMKNLLILTGPPGCGKTSSVYAVAAELAIKVIEVNASSKRTGKLMLQDLQEATQSHKVNRAGIENSQKAQEVVETPAPKIHRRKGRPKKLEVSLKKSNSKDSIKASQSSQPVGSQDIMSLILIDDADVVFDQDDGFSSAIAQLSQISKRPVILVTSSLTCPHLQKFVQCGKVININPLLPKMLGTWLDLMCLADCGACFPGLGAKFLDYFKGDMRKTINCMQFYMTPYSKECIQIENSEIDNNDACTPDDEGSNISWPDSEVIDEKSVLHTSAKEDVWKYFMNSEANLNYLSYPKSLFDVWWSISNLYDNTHLKLEVLRTKDNQTNGKVKELEAIANLTDIFSISDYISSKNQDTNCNITSEPWYSSETDSVSELEAEHGYNKSNEVTNDIVKYLVNKSVSKMQKSMGCETDTTVQSPSMAVQRERDRAVRRHNYLTDILNPSAALDRRGLALDYWSTCRSICRIEKNRNDAGSKRNNRFCHYLKSMNAAARNETFDSLGDSLTFKGKEL